MQSRAHSAAVSKTIQKVLLVTIGFIGQRFGIGGRRNLVRPIKSREQKKPDECNPFDGGVRVLKTRWKHHKSKDLTFLHRNYTQLLFSTPKTNIFWLIEKIFKKKLGKFSKNGEKSTFPMKNHMIFHWQFRIFLIFQKFPQFFFLFFSIDQNIFVFRVENKSWGIASM